MTDLKTFDQVWEEGEALFKDQSSANDLESTLKELEMKIGLYGLLGQKTEIPIDELATMKFKVMGEILLTMTQLSLIENVNVHAALKEAVLLRTIDQQAEKHGFKIES